MSIEISQETKDTLYADPECKKQIESLIADGYNENEAIKLMIDNALEQIIEEACRDSKND